MTGERLVAGTPLPNGMPVLLAADGKVVPHTVNPALLREHDDPTPTPLPFTTSWADVQEEDDG